MSKQVKEFQDADDITMLDVTLDGEIGHVKSMMRCDCLAPYLILARLTQCKLCGTHSALPMQALPDNFFDNWIEKLANMSPETRGASYEFSSLPAYTLQRRCGADPYITELYLRIRPDAKHKVEQYQERRKREQRDFETRCTKSA
ncbi:MAG: hypothetical protein ACYTEQ_15250 [Planctomycetota bacterium]